MVIYKCLGLGNINCIYNHTTSIETHRTMYTTGIHIGLPTAPTVQNSGCTHNQARHTEQLTQQGFVSNSFATHRLHPHTQPVSHAHPCPATASYAVTQLEHAMQKAARVPSAAKRNGE